MLKRRRYVFLSLVAALALVAAACGTSTTETTEAASPDTTEAPQTTDAPATTEAAPDTTMARLGLIGLLTVQLAKASGCRVLGMDPNPVRRSLATRFGCDATATSAEDFRLKIVQVLAPGGVDAVIISAATSRTAW